jgi:hypothetical protein
MLAAGSEDFYEIESVEQLWQYNIMLSHLNWQIPQEVTAPEIWPAYVCVNAHLVQGLDVDAALSLGIGTIRHWGIPDPPAGWIDHHINDFWSNACHIRFDADGSYFEVATFRSGTETGSTFLNLSAVLPPDTRIDSLPR